MRDKSQDDAHAIEEYMLRLQVLKNEDSIGDMDIASLKERRITDVENETWQTFGMFYTGSDLPPPFHKGILLTNVAEAPYLDRGHADNAVASLSHLKANLGAACDILRKITDVTIKKIAANNARLVSWKPIKYEAPFPSGGEARITCQVIVEMLTRNHEKKQVKYWIEYDGRRVAPHALTNQLLAQKNRQAAISGCFQTDEVMGRMLGKLSDRSSRNLRSLIMDPQHRAYTEERYDRDWTWNEETLKQFGIDLPEGLETIRVKDNLISGRCRITPITTWNRHTLRHKNDSLPDTIVSSLAGKNITSVIEHPAIGSGMIIEGAKTSSDGYLLVRCKSKAVDYPEYEENA